MATEYEIKLAEQKRALLTLRRASTLTQLKQQQALAALHRIAAEVNTTIKSTQYAFIGLSSPVVKYRLTFRSIPAAVSLYVHNGIIICEVEQTRTAALQGVLAEFQLDYATRILEIHFHADRDGEGIIRDSIFIITDGLIRYFAVDDLAGDDCKPFKI